MNNEITPGSAKKILQENGVEMVKIDKVWYLEKDGKRIVRPAIPKFCYPLLMSEFGIDEPRLKDFR